MKVVVVGSCLFVAGGRLYLHCNDTASSTGEPGTGAATFWKKSETAQTHYLYIDYTEKGILPFLPATLTNPGNDIVQKNGLPVTLMPGNYDIIIKDSSDDIFCEETLFMKRTASSKEMKAY